MNIVELTIETELDCNAEDGECTISLSGHSEPMNLNRIGGNDDVSLVLETLANELDFSLLPEEGETVIKFAESGEFEGFNWHAYFTLTHVGDTEITPLSEVVKQAEEQKIIGKNMALRITGDS